MQTQRHAEPDRSCRVYFWQGSEMMCATSVPNTNYWKWGSGLGECRGTWATLEAHADNGTIEVLQVVPLLKPYPIPPESGVVMYGSTLRTSRSAFRNRWSASAWTDYNNHDWDTWGDFVDFCRDSGLDIYPVSAEALDF